MLFIILLLTVYIGINIYFYLTQEKKIFKSRYSKEFIPHKLKPIYFTTSDNVKLEGGYIKNGENLPLILYFSGNANNVLEFLEKTATKIKEFNFIAFNYPGYGKSQGTPSEKTILKYALEIANYYNPDIIVGRSLGSAIATYVASKTDKKLVLITPFDSILNIAKSKYPFLPIKLLLKHKFKEFQWIKKVNQPVNILAVENDEIIPQKNLENLLKNIPNLNKLKIINNTSHAEIYKHPNIINILKEIFKF